MKKGKETRRIEEREGRDEYDNDEEKKEREGDKNDRGREG